MKKLTFEEVKSKFESKKWQLLSKEYLGSQKPLDVICPEGHQTTITWNNFQREQGCKFCAGNVKYEYEYVKKCFEEGGCELLSAEYINNLTPVEYKCECGNISKISFSDFINGVRCSGCKGQRISDSLKIPEEKIIEFCNKHGHIFIKSWIEKKDNKKGKTRISYICKCQKDEENKIISEAYWSNFERFPNCKKCGNEKVSGENHYRWNPDREKIKLNKKFQKDSERLLKRGMKAFGIKKYDHTFTMLGYSSKQLQDHILNHPNYNKSIKQHIDHIFPIKAFVDHKIHDFKLINALDNLQPLEASKNESKGGNYDLNSFKEWLKSKGFDLNNQTKDELPPDFIELSQKLKEKDIVLDYFNLKEVKNFSQFYLREKYKSTTNYFVLYSDEWQNNKEKWIGHFNSLIGNVDKIYARKCEIKEIDLETHRNFCNLYHIQRSNKLSIVAFGIFYENELMGTMSLGRHNRQNSAESDIVLDRLCFKFGYQILGGASKLFSRCIEWAKSNNCNKIISFSDNRYSSGKIYQTLNFVLEKEYSSDYSYVVLGENKRLSKQSQQKTNVDCPPELTELEWANQRGLERVYDCGKKRWVYLCQNV